MFVRGPPSRNGLDRVAFGTDPAQPVPAAAGLLADDGAGHAQGREASHVERVIPGLDAGALTLQATARARALRHKIIASAWAGVYLVITMKKGIWVRSPSRARTRFCMGEGW